MGEVTGWIGHSPERLKEMKDHIERLKAQGVRSDRLTVR
jgi:rifampin ADP-ribosylating transferase